ncbi:hypothetical protein MAP00_008726 [Monascus purpureus]|nr:hypothetical protein MAP00_008726 [Monascus purpureus]
MELKIFVWILLGLLQIPAECASIQSARISQCLRRHGGYDQVPKNSSNLYQTKFPGVTWDQDNWLLTTTTLNQGHYQSRGSVANGYLGINVASVGPFFELDIPGHGDEISGWPLFSRRQSFATISGFFDAQPTTPETNFAWLNQYGDESVISGIPHWSGLILDLGNGTYLDSNVDNRTISGFSSTYDFEAGVLSWSYQWTPDGNRGSYNITYRLFAHKLHVNQAVVDMEIIPSVQAEAMIVNVIDGHSAVRTDFVDSGVDDSAIFTAVRPWGVSNVTAYVYANITGSNGVDLSSRTLVSDKPYVHANESSIAQSVRVEFFPGKRTRVTKFVGAASSDAFSSPRWTAKKAALAALKNGYLESLHSHVSEWARVMPDDAVDDFTYPDNGTLPADDHILNSAIIAVTSTYYLLQNTVGKTAIQQASGAPLNMDSISVGGLTSDSYAGLIFWDADTWMHPGLVASHPEAAQSITDYRVAKYPQAVSNVRTAFVSSKNRTSFDASAAVYPWTSGRFGNCTGTGPCWDYEYHLNGDIGQSLVNQWIASGNTQRFREKLFPIYDSIATLYSNLLERNGSSWTLTNMTDPDEYANFVDAGAYTMPLISKTLQGANDFRKQFGLPINETWSDMADNVLLIRENNVTLEFTTMNGSAVVKQADVVLVTYPLDYTHNYSSEDALSDLDYYANRQSPDGPAMTWAIFAIVTNQVSSSGCSAYTYAQYSYDPYTRPPFFQLSEQMIDDPTVNGGTHPAFPFLTGHGGANQVNLFGYLGLRLVPDDSLHIYPNLPPQIPHLKYRTFFWHGWPLSANSNYTHTTIRRANTAHLDTADPRFANTSIPVHVGPASNITVYQLPVNGTLIIPNRQIASINSVPGDLIQCRPVQSHDEYRPGQFPISVVDGASSTKWQPYFADNVSSVTVSLDPPSSGPVSVSGFYFEWDGAPPVNASVVFHNATLDEQEIKSLIPSLFSLPKNNTSTGVYTIVTTLTNIALSNPYDPLKTDPNVVKLPSANTTNVTLPEPVPVPRFASLFVSGNQALSPEDIEAKNGTGATVGGFSILGG